MKTLVLLIAAADERAKLADALVGATGVTAIQAFAQAQTVVSSIVKMDVCAVVAELRDAAGAATLPVLLALQVYKPATPFIIRIRSLSPADAHDVVQAVRAGLEANWVVRGLEPLEPVVSRVVSEYRRTNATALLIRTVSSAVRPSMQPLVAVAALAAVRPATVAEVAKMLRTSERTLERQFRSASLPSPRRVLAWCRVLHAGWQLDTLGRTPKQVAAELRFPSIRALYNQFQRVGVPPPAVWREEQGHFRALLQRFAAELDLDISTRYRSAAREVERATEA